jgi:hypothetical protein
MPLSDPSSLGWCRLFLAVWQIGIWPKSAGFRGDRTGGVHFRHATPHPRGISTAPISYNSRFTRNSGRLRSRRAGRFADRWRR